MLVSGVSAPICSGGVPWCAGAQLEPELVARWADQAGFSASRGRLSYPRGSAVRSEQLAARLGLPSAVVAETDVRPARVLPDASGGVVCRAGSLECC